MKINLWSATLALQLARGEAAAGATIPPCHFAPLTSDLSPQTLLEIRDYTHITHIFYQGLLPAQYVENKPRERISCDQVVPFSGGDSS